MRMALGRMRTEQLRLGVVLEHIDRAATPQLVLELLDDSLQSLVMACDKLEAFLDHSAIHGCPPAGGAGLTPCCDRTLWELPKSDRITERASQVTCKGRPS